ncbi:MAG: YceI family protein [Chitinophagales bacterium]
MKTSIIAVLSFAMSMLIASPILAQENFKVDTKASTLEWIGKKVTGKHNGTIQVKSGNVSFTKGKLSGNFTIDMTTIENNDLEGEYKTKLENHLKSDDFFSVEKFPTSTFKITKAVDEGNGKYEITGDLTIKGITNPVTFPATISVIDGELRADANITFDRSKWKVKYGSGSFFDDLGDKMIYDDVYLSLSLVGK